MRIKWYGHACFRLEGSGTTIVTDPYTPATSGLPPVSEPADLVIRSSANDDFHCNAGMIPGHPYVLDALSIARHGPITVRGIGFEAFLAMESLTYKKDPQPNAMYRFEMDGISVLHLGDLGNAFTNQQVGLLGGRVDVMLALTGGPPTIELADLDDAIDKIQPRVVVPMHYRIPKLRGDFLPLEAFTSRHPNEALVTLGQSEITFMSSQLPAQLQIWVLDPAQ